MREKQAQKSAAERVFVEANVRVRSYEGFVGSALDDSAAYPPGWMVRGREGRSWDW